MRKFMFMLMVVVTVLSGMPVMAKEAEVPEVPATEEVKTYTFSEVVEEVEYYDLEEEEVEKIASVEKKVDYREEYYSLLITYSEPSEDGFEWLSVIVYNGMVEVQAKGPETMVMAEYTYRQFMEQ